MNVNNKHIIDRNYIVTEKNNTNDLSKNFDEIFKSQLEKTRTENLQFSKHANQRLNTRNINLTNEQITRVSNGVDMAKQKGLNDALVLVDDIALVVNTKNNVIVTVMNKEKNNIFTNIDGAIIV